MPRSVRRAHEAFAAMMRERFRAYGARYGRNWAHPYGTCGAASDMSDPSDQPDMSDSSDPVQRLLAR